MNPFIKKLVDSKFMTEAQGNYIEEAVMRKDSIIISGHKGFGILPFCNYKRNSKKQFQDKADKRL